MCKADCEAPEDHPWFQPVPQSGPGWHSLAREAFDLINEERLAGGCCAGAGCFEPAQPLSWDETLEASARRYALELVTRDALSHLGLRGDTPFDRMRAEGFVGCSMAENLGGGIGEPTLMVQDWVQSTEHCLNLRDRVFTRAGIAFRSESNVPLPLVWVFLLGAP